MARRPKSSPTLQPECKQALADIGRSRRYPHAPSGSLRLLAARKAGLDTAPVVYLDIGADEAHLLGMALNAIHGEWDEVLLSRLLADLDATPDADLSLTGFAEDEIRTLLRSLDAREKRARPEHFDLDIAFEQATRAPQTKRGNIWQLGEHRLLCGVGPPPPCEGEDVVDLRGHRCLTVPPVASGRRTGGPAGRRPCARAAPASGPAGEVGRPRDSSHKDSGEFSSERTEYAVGPDPARVAVALGEFDVGVQEQYALWRTTVVPQPDSCSDGVRVASCTKTSRMGGRDRSAHVGRYPVSPGRPKLPKHCSLRPAGGRARGWYRGSQWVKPAGKGAADPARG